MRETCGNIRGGSACHKMELSSIYVIPTKNIYVPKTLKKWEVCFKLTIKESERHHQPRRDVFIVNFAHIPHLILLLLLLASNRQMFTG